MKIQGRQVVPSGQDSIFPLSGLNVRDQSTLIPANFSPGLLNFILLKGRARSRRGYNQLGPQLQISAVNDTSPVMMATMFETLAGAKHLIVSTTKRQYRYDASGSGTWTDITMKKITFKYLAVTGTFIPGEVVQQTTSGATATYITKDGTNVYLSYLTGVWDAVAGHTATGVDSAATASQHGTPVVTTAFSEFTGTDTDGVDFCVGADENGKYIYFTNGVDRPRRWDGSTTFVEDCRFNLEGLLKVKTLAIFAGSMVLGNVTLTSGVNSQSIAWSDTSNFNEWGTGNSGAQLLPDAGGSIQRLLPLGDRMVIYSDDSIGLMTYIGSGSIFTTEQVVQETSLLCGRAIVNVGPYHVLATKNDIMMFDGSRQMKNFGELLDPLYSASIVLEYAQRSFAFYDAPWQRVYIVTPFTSTVMRSFVAQLDLNVLGKAEWTREQYYHSPNTMGFYQLSATILWNSASIAGLTWNQRGGTWDERSNQKNFKTKLLGSNGFLYTFDDGTLGDAGQSIEAYWDTKDFVVPGEYRSTMARWQEVEIELRGADASQVKFYYSTSQPVNPVLITASDELTNFNTTTGILTHLDSNWKKIRLFMDVTADLFRVRIVATGATNAVEFRLIRAWFVPSGRNS